jgi:hypothetical protein
MPMKTRLDSIENVLIYAVYVARSHLFFNVIYSKQQVSMQEH